MNGDGRGERRLGRLVFFDLTRRWRRGDIPQEDATIFKSGQDGAANAGTVLGLIRRAKGQQCGDGGDGQRIGSRRDMDHDDITPIGDT